MVRFGRQSAQYRRQRRWFKLVERPTAVLRLGAAGSNPVRRAQGMPWPRRKRFRLNMMVLLHIGGADPAIGPAPAPVVQRQDDGLQNRQRRFDSSPACVFPIHGRTTPSAAPSHRTAGRTGPVRPRIGSLPFAFVAQRIGHPPPEREATGSNNPVGTVGAHDSTSSTVGTQAARHARTAGR